MHSQPKTYHDTVVLSKSNCSRKQDLDINIHSSSTLFNYIQSNMDEFDELTYSEQSLIEINDVEYLNNSQKYIRSIIYRSQNRVSIRIGSAFAHLFFILGVNNIGVTVAISISNTNKLSFQFSYNFNGGSFSKDLNCVIDELSFSNIKNDISTSIDTDLINHLIYINNLTFNNFIYDFYTSYAAQLNNSYFYELILRQLLDDIIDDNLDEVKLLYSNIIKFNDDLFNFLSINFSSEKLSIQGDLLQAMRAFHYRPYGYATHSKTSFKHFMSLISSLNFACTNQIVLNKIIESSEINDSDLKDSAEKHPFSAFNGKFLNRLFLYFFEVFPEPINRLRSLFENDETVFPYYLLMSSTIDEDSFLQNTLSFWGATYDSNTEEPASNEFNVVYSDSKNLLLTYEREFYIYNHSGDSFAQEIDLSSLSVIKSDNNSLLNFINALNLIPEKLNKLLLDIKAISQSRYNYIQNSLNSNSNSNLLHLSHLDKKFEIDTSKCPLVGFIGKNGTGKTTSLLQIVNSFSNDHEINESILQLRFTNNSMHIKGIEYLSFSPFQHNLNIEAFNNEVSLNSIINDIDKHITPDTLGLVNDILKEELNTDDIKKIAHNGSDGQKYIIKLILKILSYKDEKNLFLIDEIENHLHPSMIHNILTCLYNLANKFQLTFIIATHSVHVIQSIDNTNVLVFDSNFVKPLDYKTLGQSYDYIESYIFGTHFEDKAFFRRRNV